MSGRSDEFVHEDVFIRAHHPDAFRSGQWGKVLRLMYLPALAGENPREPRPVFEVEWVDGKRDLWAVYNQTARYEFSGPFVGYSTFTPEQPS